MKKAIVYFALFSTLMLSSCDTVSPKLESDFVITSGQSFGECFGTCTQYFELNATSPVVTFETRAANPSNTEYNNSYQATLDESDWNEILSEINTTKIRALNEVYGCPDCADGGAEWIEISDSLGKYKVTFEYGKEVKGIENLIILLRNQRNALSNKFLTSD